MLPCLSHNELLPRSRGPASSQPCIGAKTCSFCRCSAAPPQVAATLNDQTKKLEKIVDDLNEIEFTMKKASAVIRDITRGLLTDK